MIRLVDMGTKTWRLPFSMVITCRRSPVRQKYAAAHIVRGLGVGLWSWNRVRRLLGGGGADFRSLIDAIRNRYGVGALSFATRTLRACWPINGIDMETYVPVGIGPSLTWEIARGWPKLVLWWTPLPWGPRS